MFRYEVVMTSPEIAQQAGAAAARQGRILVMDDDSAVRDSLELYLDQAGYEVFVAADGAHGLELMQQHQPDVVLCDLRMPHVDGMSVLKELSHQSEDTPVIVISSAGEMADVVEALRLGARDYFIKPLADMGVLEHAIERSLEEVRLRRENTRYREELERANQQLATNLRMLEHDQQAGRQMQKRLLPKSPVSFGPYTFRHRIYPSLYLSGDFVEYTLVGEEKVTFFIADIAGHGVSSAFVTALLKNFTAHLRSDYRNHGRDNILRPRKFLEKMSHDMLRTGIGKHMTMVIGVLDMVSNRLRYSVAGHLPLPVLVSPGQAPKFLPGKGMAAGMFEAPSFEEHEIDLPDTFSLALFSDGMLELLPAEKLADKERMLLDMMRSEPKTIADMVEGFGLDLDEDTETPDDIAILMVTKT
jgi:serine phosphatase RsbU (regulator of sigma subunit)